MKNLARSWLLGVKVLLAWMLFSFIICAVVTPVNFLFQLAAARVETAGTFIAGIFVVLFYSAIIPLLYYVVARWTGMLKAVDAENWHYVIPEKRNPSNQAIEGTAK